MLLRLPRFPQEHLTLRGEFLQPLPERAKLLCVGFQSRTAFCFRGKSLRLQANDASAQLSHLALQLSLLLLQESRAVAERGESRFQPLPLHALPAELRPLLLALLKKLLQLRFALSQLASDPGIALQE